MHASSSQALITKYKTALSGLAIQDGDFDFGDLVTRLEPLYKEVKKTAAELISADNLEIRVIFDVIKTVTPDMTGKLLHLLGEAKLLEMAQSFEQLIASQPEKCSVSIPLDSQLPEGVHKIVLAENVFLETISSNDKGGSSDKASALVLALAGGHTSEPRDNKAFLTVHVSGYSFLGRLTEKGVRDAYALLRQVIYLGLGADCFTHKSWSTSFKPIKAILNTATNGTKKIDFPPSFQAYIANLQIAEGAFKRSYLLGPSPDTPEGKIENYQQRAKIISDFTKRPANEIAGIDRAIDWAFEAILNRNHEKGFVQTCIGLETILGDDNLQDHITKRLADRASYLLASDRMKRAEIGADIEKIYRLRSQVVHGRQNITTADEELVSNADNYLRRCIMKEIQSLANSDSGLLKYFSLGGS